VWPPDLRAPTQTQGRPYGLQGSRSSQERPRTFLVILRVLRLGGECGVRFRIPTIHACLRRKVRLEFKRTLRRETSSVRVIGRRGVILLMVLAFVVWVRAVEAKKYRLLSITNTSKLI